jgi:hypothetical protein
VTLVPTTLPELGNRAVIQHDLNVYDVLIGLGTRAEALGGLDLWLAARTRHWTIRCCTSRPSTRRRPPGGCCELDIQTALCLMNIPFALCLTGDEYRRAVHSMKLDTSLMALLEPADRRPGVPGLAAGRVGGPGGLVG